MESDLINDLVERTPSGDILVTPMFSECIEAAGWAYVGNGTGDLEIHFTDGSVYTYHYVSPLVYNNLFKANSPGGFFNRYIRNNYTFD